MERQTSTTTQPASDVEAAGEPGLRRAPAPYQMAKGTAEHYAVQLKAESASGGDALDEPVRQKMEGAFDADFSSVRVHQGGAAGALGAQAFTQGDNIHFAPGRYDPGSPSGQSLIGHELTHVMQQRSDAVELPQGKDSLINRDPALESEADRLGERAAAGEQVTVSGGAGQSLQRKADGPVQCKGDIDATEDALGQHVVNAMNTANGSWSVSYADSWRPKLEEKKTWNEAFRQGRHMTSLENTDSAFFKQPQELGYMKFQLLPGHSASAGLQAWLKGPTIAECLSSVYAMETDAVRAGVGNAKFDEMFGSTDAAKDKAVDEGHRRLELSANNQTVTVQAQQLLKATELRDLHKPTKDLKDADYAKLKKGEWYYFQNHPLYPQKHPAGYWQGENALFMGYSEDEAHQRIWAGLGASNETEDQMYKQLVDDFNTPRSERDYKVMIDRNVLVEDDKGPERVGSKQYRYANDAYKPDRFPAGDITAQQMIQAGGGFRTDVGLKIDAAKVAQMAAPPADEKKAVAAPAQPQQQQQQAGKIDCVIL